MSGPETCGKKEALDMDTIKTKSFPFYEFFVRLIYIQKYEIFQSVFEGFMGFLCILDSKIRTA